MPKPLRWEIAGEATLAQVAQAPQEAKRDFKRLLDRLTRNPRDRRAGVLPLKSRPGGYTAPFDDALLVYSVLADYPRIELLLIVWNQSD